VAFLDIAPRTKGQTLVVSKKHFENFESLPPELLGELNLVTQAVVKNIKSKLKAKGVSMAVNSGELAGQRIPHFALIVYPRYEEEETKGVPVGAFFKPIETNEEELTELAKKLNIKLSVSNKTLEPKKEQIISEKKSEQKEQLKEELVGKLKSRNTKKKTTRKKEYVEFV